MTAIKQIFAQNPVFGALPPPRREALIREAIPRRLARGEALAFAGDVWPYLFLVTGGGIDAIKESLEGRSLVVTTFQPGDIFWGLAFFYEDMTLPVTLKAGDASQVYLWPRERIIPLLKEMGEFSWELARLMIRKMNRASEILEAMTFQPVAGRLARLLVDTSRSEAGEAITRSLTLDEMAARIGSTREMVCRFLHRFADDGIIEITRTEYRVTDAGRLADLARNAKG